MPPPPLPPPRKLPLKANEPYSFNFCAHFASSTITLFSDLQKIMPRGANFSREELGSFLNIVENVLPLSATQWESVAETHLARYPDKGRTMDSLKRKFKELYIKRIPSGDPHCPPVVLHAKQLRNAIMGDLARRVSN
jgi:hypothetical protein